ncbi:3-dehydroshikimate dehydratase [Myriangium duriaei CBS 260.36]|uniref:3-dehydroshikimate dehydratase n=1 Tax=Myriangium duriaei CBS 260.36 TaxID=1168546 RepID=A0A9P4MJP2_9PEZI|nr:3-dehydroshikimate dehydratase [Myriangium duriaei CBS 260.36]
MSWRPAISSMSLGRAWVHEMPEKLDQAAAAGLEGIEIFFEDLDYAAKALPGGSCEQNRKTAAKRIRELCTERGLTIICLQPFLHSEGLLDRSKRAEILQELKHWFDLASILGADLIQMPATFLPRKDLTSDIGVIVSDMREVADLGAAHDPPFRFAMESLCFSTHIDTWEQCWDVVSRVDRPNFGVCLDTFNIGGKIYGDPASPTGTIHNATNVAAASISRLAHMRNPDKIFYIQVVDAERLSSPLIPGHPLYDPTQPARMSWSRSCRLFYGEQDRGAYLPIKDITRAIINDLGYRGWVSMEYFNADMTDPNPDVPARLAKRAMAAWARITEDTGLAERGIDSPTIIKTPSEALPGAQYEHEHEPKQAHGAGIVKPRVTVS